MEINIGKNVIALEGYKVRHNIKFIEQLKVKNNNNFNDRSFYYDKVNHLCIVSISAEHTPVATTKWILGIIPSAHEDNTCFSINSTNSLQWAFPFPFIHNDRWCIMNTPSELSWYTDKIIMHILDIFHAKISKVNESEWSPVPSIGIQSCNEQLGCKRSYPDMGSTYSDSIEPIRCSNPE